MKVSKVLWQQVRIRAKCTCEFCGVTETDAGGELTVDHFVPKSKGGSDDLENLVYCCFRCNHYKHSYFAKNSLLWNPRLEPFSQHFFELDNGMLQPLTACGEFTLELLHLNREPLVKFRLKRSTVEEQTHLLAQFRDWLLLVEQMDNQTSTLMLKQLHELRQKNYLINLTLSQEDE